MLALAGKTYTMQGGGGADACGESAGLIPRSVRQILQAAQRAEGQGWRYSLEVSFLEVRCCERRVGAAAAATAVDPPRTRRQPIA